MTEREELISYLKDEPDNLDRVLMYMAHKKKQWQEEAIDDYIKIGMKLLLSGHTTKEG